MRGNHTFQCAPFHIDQRYTYAFIRFVMPKRISQKQAHLKHQPNAILLRRFFTASPNAALRYYGFLLYSILCRLIAIFNMGLACRECVCACGSAYVYVCHSIHPSISHSFQCACLHSYTLLRFSLPLCIHVHTHTGMPFSLSITI